MDSLFSGWETGIGLDVVVWLQAHTPEPLRGLAVVLSILGGFPVYLLLFLALYWSVDKRLARRFLATLLVAGLVIAALKLGLQRPRPFVAFPDLVYAALPEGTYGFPSGHVGITLPVLGILAAEARRRWAWWLLAVYILLMGWARMVVGVHYPQDIIAGCVIGLVVLAVMLRTPTRLLRIGQRISATRAALLLLVAAVGILALRRDVFAVAAAGIILGATPGFLLAQRIGMSVAGPVDRRVSRAALGLVFIGLLLALLVVAGLLAGPLPAQVVAWALVAFAGVAVYPWLALRLGLAEPETSSPGPFSTAKRRL